MMELQFAKAAPPGTYIAFGLALFIWHAAAALLGAFIADRLGVSDSGFNFKSDLKKTALCSFVALALFFPLFYFAQSPAVFIVTIIGFLLALKLAYLGEGHGFRLIVLGAVLAGLLVFVPVVSALRLPGTFFLYVVGFALLAVFHLSRRRTERTAKESGDRKERRIRLLASSDPNFATPCYRCRFWRSEGARCLLRLAGDEVREITIDQRRYCASFEPGREPEELGESPGSAGE